MPRWAKILLGAVAGLIVLILINALVVSNATKDAYVRNTDGHLIQTSSGTLQFMDQGDPYGSPIVLIHCYTCSMYWWDRLAPLLGRDHRVIRFDLLGHGGSDKPSTGYSMEDQAAAIAEALAKLGVVDATVVGHSLGGAVATALAQQSPRLASRVVIIDEAPANDVKDESLTQRMSYWPIVGQAIDRLTQIAPKSAVRGQYDRAFAPGFDYASGFQDPEQPVEDLRTMTYTSYTDSAGDEDDYVKQEPLDQRLAATQVPVMAIFGAEDQIYDPRAALARYAAIGAQTHLIPGAGHSPNVEKPSLVAPLVLAFAAQPKTPGKGRLRHRIAATGGR